MAIAIIGAFVLAKLWQDRPAIDELNWSVADTGAEIGDAVTVTWLGVTTLLFDDGETQILTDGFFTRDSAFNYAVRDLSTDIATVNFAMAEFRINRLAAIIPLHSHFDHAMDAGIVANRSSAVVLGSESTANIVRGANLPIDQYQILADREIRQFGNFTIQLIVSSHAPVRDGERAWFTGNITEPLRQPAPIDAWKEGVSYSVVIRHPRGTSLVQGSAGFIPGNLAEVEADVVMLGVGGIDKLGEEYLGRYWAETISTTGAQRIFPVHYDDFALPFGEIELMPRIVDNVVGTATRINEIAQSEEHAAIVERLPFGQRVVLY